MTQLFPRPPRKMRQPRKELLRQHLASATAELIELRAEVDRLRGELDAAHSSPATLRQVIRRWFARPHTQESK